MTTNSLGQYRIVECVGEGGMGAVYRATDEMLDREVAIKLMRPELAHRADLAERFRSEAVILARLDHPNIARLHGLAREGDQWFMVMEFVPGETLLRRLERGGRIHWTDAIRTMAQLLDALEYAHALGVVHRDVKPANLILRPDGRLKVTDFGIARVLGASRATRAGHVVGTLEYMAPEQIRGEDVDGRADIYAAGIVLYEMLAGVVPFTATSEYALMTAQLHAPVPSLQTLGGEVPADLDQHLARALAKGAADRFPTAAAFRAALEAVLASNPAAAIRPTRLADTPPPRRSHQTTVPMPLSAEPNTPVAPTRLAEASPPTRLAPPPVPATRLAVGVQGAAPPVAAPAATRPAAASPLDWLSANWRRTVAAVAVVAIAVSAAVGLNHFRRPPAQDAPLPARPIASEPQTLAPPSGVAMSGPSFAPGSDQPVQPTPRVVSPEPARPSMPGPTAPPATPIPTPLPSAPVQAPTTDTIVRVPSAPSRPELGTAQFDRVALLVVDGKKSHEVDIVLKLEGSRVVARDRKTAQLLRTFPYSQIEDATYSQSKHPRWKSGAAAVLIGGVFGAPVLFLKGTKHWLTLEGHGEVMVLHLDKRDYDEVLSALERRSGIDVVHRKGN